jgi:hypothetical protein
MARQISSVVSTILALGLLALMASLPAVADPSCDPAQPAARAMAQADLPAAPTSALPLPEAEQTPRAPLETPALSSEDSTCDPGAGEVELLSGLCYLPSCSASEACYYQFCENGSTGECDVAGCEHEKCIQCYNYCEAMECPG